MIYPSIDKLLGVVGSKYQLVHVVSNRSRQMYETKQYQMKERDYSSKKNIGRALEELSENLIHINK
jgi:DNA-directed RNA polymerase subunit omega